jgi:hypothetical protein
MAQMHQDFGAGPAKAARSLVQGPDTTVRARSLDVDGTSRSLCSWDLVLPEDSGTPPEAGAYYRANAVGFLERSPGGAARG